MSVENIIALQLWPSNVSFSSGTNDTLRNGILQKLPENRPLTGHKRLTGTWNGYPLIRREHCTYRAMITTVVVSGHIIVICSRTDLVKAGFFAIYQLPA